MRNSRIAIAAALIVVAVLGIWLWPSAGSKATTEKKNSQADSTTLEMRREARRSGQVSTAPASLAGRVIDAGNQAPVAGALISIRPRKIDGGMISKAGQSPAPVIARTDAAGRFVIPGLSAGSYSVSASASGYKPQAQDAITLEAGRDRDDVLFSLSQGGHHLRGLVSDIGGGPVGFAQVRATLVSGFSIGTLFRAPFTASTDSEGLYELQPRRWPLPGLRLSRRLSPQREARGDWR